jgi:3-oxoacyl-[acyl-carrier-protein] synthase-1
VLEKLDTTVIEQVVSDAFQDEMTTSVLGGWVDCEDKEHFEAHLFLVDKENADGLSWNKKTINELIQ